MKWKGELKERNIFSSGKVNEEYFFLEIKRCASRLQKNLDILPHRIF